jgi:hypothetical protein
MRTVEQIREALGLPTTDVLVEEGRLDAPATGVGRGLSIAAAGTGLSAQAIQAILAQPNFTSDPQLDRYLGTTSAARWDHDPRFVTLGDAPVSRRAGAAEDVPTLGWLIDTRGFDTAVVLEDARSHVTRFLSAANGAVHLGRIEHATPTISTITFREPPPLELPDLGSVLESLRTKRWLRDEIERRSVSGSVLARTAAAGLTLRLAMSELDDPDRVFGAIVSGGADPLDVIRTWASSLALELVAYIEAAALDEAGALADHIEDLTRLVSRDPIEAGQAALWLRQRRDDLESVRVVLQQAAVDLVLVDALNALDRRASSELSAFDMVGDADSDPLLFGAVASVLPGAWWGTAWPE